MGATSRQREQIRNVVLSHAHLDHIAGLPLFIDDLFAVLKEPICVHATREVIEILEQDIFNWRIYPRFSVLENEFGRVFEYHQIAEDTSFHIENLRITPVKVNHKVPSVGFFIEDGETTIALSSDTAQMNDFWQKADEKKLSTILIECAFPNDLIKLAQDSHHLTPNGLARELQKLSNQHAQIYVINLKPMYRRQIIEQIESLHVKNLQILEVGKVYDF